MSGGLTVGKVPYSIVFVRKSPQNRRGWGKMPGTFRSRNGLQVLVGGNECGRCAGSMRKVCFRGDTFRTRNALQVAVGQYDCGRCAFVRHTFRKRVGHLVQKQRGPSANITRQKQVRNKTKKATDLNQLPFSVLGRRIELLLRD